MNKNFEKVQKMPTYSFEDADDDDDKEDDISRIYCMRDDEKT